jgi:acyl-CoA thioester hydrolase
MDLAVPVRWQDLDALGHVNHAVYLTYFEEHRDRWLSERLGLCGRDYVVASAHVDYEAPVTLKDGPVTVSGHIERSGQSSLTFVGVLRSAVGHVCARSRTSIVLWDARRGESRALTAHERAMLDVAAAADQVPATGLPSRPEF